MKTYKPCFIEKLHILGRALVWGLLINGNGMAYSQGRVPLLEKWVSTELGKSLGITPFSSDKVKMS